jgi:hypothetical protein
MAQLVAHHTGSVGVRGSSPLSSTKVAVLEPGSPAGRPADTQASGAGPCQVARRGRQRAGGGAARPDGGNARRERVGDACRHRLVGRRGDVGGGRDRGSLRAGGDETTHTIQIAWPKLKLSHRQLPHLFAMTCRKRSARHARYARSISGKFLVFPSWAVPMLALAAACRAALGVASEGHGHRLLVVSRIGRSSATGIGRTRLLVKGDHHLRFPQTSGPVRRSIAAGCGLGLSRDTCGTGCRRRHRKRRVERGRMQ